MTVRENLSLGRLARKTDGSNGGCERERILEYFPRLKERMDVAADYLFAASSRWWRWRAPCRAT